MNHQLWLVMWFVIGMGLAMLNKADDRSRGNDPNVNKWWEYFSEYWIPVLTRAAIESALFFALFNTALLTKGLDALGWSSWSWAAMMVTQFAPAAFGFGFAVDPVLAKIINLIGPMLPFNVPNVPAPQHVQEK